ncbi:hypothetical protein HG535_0H04240 [Zygotorulaspora mrakii]|uniref:alpha-1,2-Mannosidase n=1 Tax=Zygotorulaspora mrakii TaxID=42260 RepID=A0A7H9B901_ZYGMR|nr:uncharacterized protein HG535_0H04240 [Zygotorulaspora mrakii]QLG75097.1 hypothetical protein HG535_0H04240 [Zygotorulaspora mrakii]
MVIKIWILLCLFVGCCVGNSSFRLQYSRCSFTKQELNDYRREVQDLIYFAHDSYLKYGYPHDELRPISCLPKTRNFADPNDVITNDVLGNFSATLIDSLTTIAVLNDKRRFKETIELIAHTFPQKFDLDSTIQVFETTIRIIGGLLSSHLYATDPTKAVYLGSAYNGVLLDLAKDMADRLLPAYLTSTGLPLPRVNLRHGLKTIDSDLLMENNVAAMASPMFEFTVLSYLTFDEKYAAVTRYAMDKIWSLRSNIDLLPMSFSPHTGQCYSPVTGVGASIDSFYEYALKGALLFDDNSLYEMWDVSYRALTTYCKSDWFFTNAQYITGQTVVSWIDSLSAFFPGLQVLAGHVEDAIYKNIMSLKLWNTFGGVPERWLFRGNLSLLDESLKKNVRNTREEVAIPQDLHRALVPLEWYPLRPEFIESTYYLYRATKDPFYLNIGINILGSLKTKFNFKCGFGGMQDVILGSPQDRMETFVLSETLKYLFLLFDENNELHHSRDNVIFSTEGHPMWLKTEAIRQYSSKRFFNDTVYLKHLQKCRRKDKIAMRRNNRIDNMKNALAGLAKSFFVDEKEDLSGEKKNKDEHRRANLSLLDSYTCTASYNQKHATNWPYSPILSSFNKLFEIEASFAETLRRPAHMIGNTAMEIEQNFYELWADPFQSICLLPTTTESVHLLIEHPKDAKLTVLKNGDIFCTTLKGSLKLALEKVKTGQIDNYGNYITTELFENIDCDDIFNPYHPNRLYSPIFLYRVVAVNGINLQQDANMILARDLIVSDPGQIKTFTQIFGCNANNQLLLENIPIINFLLI